MPFTEKAKVKVKLRGFVTFLRLTGDEFLHTEAPARLIPSHKLAANVADEVENTAT